MEIQQRLIYFTISMTLLVGCGYFMKRRGIMPEAEASMILAKITVNYALPAMIFWTLANSKLSLHDFKLPAIVLLIEIGALIASYLAGRAFKLSREQIGSLMLVSTFGNMSALGVSLVDSVYNHNLSAISKAVLSSEIGSQLALQTLGILIAIHFGTGKDVYSPVTIFKEILFNPPTLAIIFGLIWSLAGFPTEGMLLTPVFHAIKLADMALAGVVGLLIGFSIRYVNIRLFIKTAVVVIILELFYEPLGTFFASKLFSLPKFDADVLVLMMSMPAAALNVAFAKKYGCDTELAANLTITSIIFCIISVFFVSYLL